MNTMGITPWNYVGVVCFPNLENRKALQDAGAVTDEEDLKVLIKTIQTFNQNLLPSPIPSPSPPSQQSLRSDQV